MVPAIFAGSAWRVSTNVCQSLSANFATCKNTLSPLVRWITSYYTAGELVQPSNCLQLQFRLSTVPACDIEHYVLSLLVLVSTKYCFEMKISVLLTHPSLSQLEHSVGSSSESLLLQAPFFRSRIHQSPTHARLNLSIFSKAYCAFCAENLQFRSR